MYRAVAGWSMPWSWFSLGVALWLEAWPHLSKVSRRHPPTHCQLLFYYWLLLAEMNDHRDNSNNKDLCNLLQAGKLPGGHGHPSGGAENSQAVGSSVMVFTTGSAPMTFTLSFPSRVDPLGRRKVSTS